MDRSVKVFSAPQRHLSTANSEYGQTLRGTHLRGFISEKIFKRGLDLPSLPQ